MTFTNIPLKIIHYLLFRNYSRHRRCAGQPNNFFLETFQQSCSNIIEETMKNGVVTDATCNEQPI